LASSAPEAVETLPEPSLRLPCQIADAFCFIVLV
jgi:hypothetical protein